MRIVSLSEDVPPVAEAPVPEWTAKKLGRWKKTTIWEVSYKGTPVSNAFGQDATEAIGMAQHANPHLPR